MRRLPLLFGLALLTVAPAQAQNGSGIFMGDDMVLRAGHPLQLSLNAHVTQFLYQPTSDHIAYVSIKDDGTTQTASVEYVTTRHPDPETATLEKFAGASPDAATPTGDVYTATLMDWSSDGRYLPFEVDTLPNGDKEAAAVSDYYLADTAAQAFTVQVRQLPSFPTPDGFSGLTESAWSPDQSRLLISQEGTVPVDPKEDIETFLGAIYDAQSGQMHVLRLPSDGHVIGWQDDAHLLLKGNVQPDGTSAYSSYDVAADTVTPIPQTAIWPPKPQILAHYYPSASTTAPKAPGLTLETDQQAVADPQNAAQAPVWTVWLRRPSAPKPMSALTVAVVHDAERSSVPGSSNEDDSDPQPQWAPDGDVVAYLAHGDLFVAPLTESPASPYEKVAVGEKLDCREEQIVVASNLKQIGRGLMQWAQDNGEKYPAAAGWQDAILPYVKDSSLFNFAGVPVNYSPPQNLAIASIDSPADLPLATADTPCAHIVLMADGHVQNMKRNGNQ